MRISFDAIQVQVWMAAGEKLTDLSGGSEILEELVSEKETGLLGKALAACEIEPEAIVLNAASRFKLVVTDADKAHAFCELWPLIVETVAPGLEYAFSVENDGEDQPIRSIHAPQALIGPLSMTSPRTGKVVSIESEGEARELLDRGANLRRQAGIKADRSQGNADQAASELLSKLEIADIEGFEIELMRDADKLSTRDGRRNLAYVYADGSGIGRIIGDAKGNLIDLVGEAGFDKILRAFSQALDDATFAATRTALKEVAITTRNPKLQIRPVLIGGDDMSMVLPARQGHLFAVSYMHAFKRESSKIAENVASQFKEHKDKIQEAFPKELRIGCGVAFVHPHFPASRALELAEELGTWAKTVVGRLTSALAFHRVTGSTIRSYEEIWKEELTQGEHTISAGPYVLEDVSPEAFGPLEAVGKTPDDLDLIFAKQALGKFITVDQLGRLVTAFANPGIPSGPQHEILDLAHKSLPDADRKLVRMVEISKDGDGTAYKHAMEELTSELKHAVGVGERTWVERAIGFDAKEELGLNKVSSQKATPIGDLHALISVANEPGENDKTPLVAKPGGAS